MYLYKPIKMLHHEIMVENLELLHNEESSIRKTIYRQRQKNNSCIK